MVQNRIERGKSSINSPKSKELLSCKPYKQVTNKIRCLKDIYFRVWNTIVKDIPKWTQTESLRDSYFNSVDLASFYPSLELFKTYFSTDLQEILFEIVIFSKGLPEISRAASNAISILNKLGYSFNNTDLQSTNIPYADLSNSLFINTNFKDSSLNSANFNQSNLYHVNFKNCDLKNAKFSKNHVILSYKKVGESFDVSRCGRYLVAFGFENEARIRLWEIESDKLLKEINCGDLGLMHLLRFSPSARYIGIIKSGIVTLYDLQNEYKIIKFEGFFYNASCFAFSSCETYFAAGSMDNSIKVWYLKSQALIHMLNGHAAQVVDVSFSPCNKLLYSAGDDSYILVWDFDAKGKIVPCYKGTTFIRNKKKKGKKLIKRFQEEKWVKSITPSSNGKFLICLSQNISVWNINLGEKVLLYCPTLFPSQASFNQINLIAFRREDGAILGFDIETQQFTYQIYCEPGKESRKLVFMPNGKSIAAASKRQGISFFDISDVNSNKSIKKSNYTVNSISFSPCGNYFVTHCGEAEIELWDFAQHKVIKHLYAGSPNHAVKTIIYSSSGDYIAMPSNNLIFIYSPHLDLLHEFSGCTSYIKALTISHDGKLIAVGTVHDEIVLWEKSLDSIKQVCTLNGRFNCAKYLGFTRNKGIIVSCFDDNKIKVWSYKEEKCIHFFKNHQKLNVILQVSPSQQIFVYAFGSSTDIFLYDLNSNDGFQSTFKRNGNNPYKYIKFSPSGKYIAALSLEDSEIKCINNIYIWLVESRELLVSFNELEDLITCIEFSTSEKIIALGFKNGIIKFWEWQNLIK
ncbi:unnamed protein product [Blepharisma stoltei]|uniref:Uncharacterized protein n=1 Tax=Blepharisma stoltei TaxID=1481888 RepID=A0AAU9IG81_9CILI|nr:unnamed protein product [Blepharisma stoltei]